MRQGIGSVVLYNIIIVFIVITFGFLSATLSYMKAFKINGRIVNSLEKFEGYNKLSESEIDTVLSTIGYRVSQTGSSDCPDKKYKGKSYQALHTFDTNHKYCIYEFPKENGYFHYGVLTYVYMDVPVVGGTFSLPVYAETERIYEFTQKR